MKLLTNKHYDILLTKAEANRKFEVLVDVLTDLPYGVHIRKIQPRNAGNNWAVFYRDYSAGERDGEYFGKTLGDALHKLLTQDERLDGKFNRWYVEDLIEELDF